MINNKVQNYFKENYPLLKIIRFDSSNQLIYDARANMLFIISDEDLPIVTEYLRTHDKTMTKLSFPETQGIEEVLTRIDDLQNKGVLLPGPVDKLISTESQDVKKLIEYYMENILMRKFVLETTQQCNFRCKYCHNTLETVFRHHTNKHMTLPVAKAAIDFYKQMYLKFFSKLTDDKKRMLLDFYPPYIGFYGGEPSLNWNLVEEASEYYIHAGWKEHGIQQKDLGISINSNLFILTDKMMSFLLKNRPLLYVSLDGPREDNDRNRVTVDGQGTFDKVFANLQRIKENAPEYFREKVMILCVEAEGNDNKAVHNLLDSMGCSVNYMKEQPHDCLEKDPEKQILDIEINEQKSIDDCIHKYKKRIAENDPEALEEFDSLYFLENIQNDAPYRRRLLSVNLTCPLCVDNIMIDTEGGMHLCHKTDGSLPLGNVCESGYDMQKMFEAYKSYGETTNCLECRSCWAMNNCGYCAALRLKGGKWFNPRPIECDLHRRNMEYQLKLFIAAYKLDPDILPKLMDRKHDLNHYKSIVDYNEFIRLTPKQKEK